MGSLAPPDGAQAGDGKMGSVRHWYGDLLNVEQSMLHALDAYRTDNFMAFSGGWIEARRYRWSKTLESVWETGQRGYLLDLSLSGRGDASTAVNLTSGYAPYRPGSIHMVPPGQKMRCITLGAGQSRSVRCVLDADLIDAVLQDTPEWTDAALRETFRIGGGEIEWVMQRMYRELHNPDFGAVHVIEGLARELSVAIVRRFRLHVRERQHRAGGLPPWQMRLIRDRVYSDGPLPDREELASLCTITVRHLARAFRAETGQTIGKYIEGAMTERASALLKGGTPVAEIAHRLGYATSGSFACSFRRATGLLPTELRRGVC